MAAAVFAMGGAVARGAARFAHGPARPLARGLTVNAFAFLARALARTTRALACTASAKGGFARPAGFAAMAVAFTPTGLTLAFGFAGFATVAPATVAFVGGSVALAGVALALTVAFTRVCRRDLGERQH
jgi:hypothetical protein